MLIWATTTRTPPYFARTPPLNPIFNHNLFAPGAGRNTSFFTNHRAQYSHKHQLSDLHHHLNCFNMSIKLAPPAEGYYEHISLDVLVKQINEHVKSEEYCYGPDMGQRSPWVKYVNDWNSLFVSRLWEAPRRGAGHYVQDGENTRGALCYACPNAHRVVLSSLTRHHPREYVRLLSTALRTAVIG